MPNAELQPLIELSARIGQNLDLVQAGGGNTSLKQNGTLWVKASGKWLADALIDEMFVPVPMADVLAKLAAHDERFAEYPTSSGALLRPSVETTVHAVFPQRVVVHVHSVRAISWAVRRDGAAQIRERLDGLHWAWIPYIHPGVPLAEYIRRELNPKPDVLIIQNHGLVVAAEDCAAAEALLGDVEVSLSEESLAAPAPDLSYLRELCGNGPWAPAENDEVHALGTDSRFCGIAARGTMYPDHCVYLGPAAPVVHANETIQSAIEQYQTRYSYQPGYALIDAKGVLTNKLSRAGQQLLVCLKRIVERIPEQTEVNYLDDREVAALMNWDAEKYRLSMASSLP
ncbi:MAG TPA: class II aldolase/adducin family protein [Bryobacteraceae bacterium]|jgi:rhamnose utilization protein RhaD (predicted bifunctional aldolase and dehydrogenase)|nr:class II aldolase/adducin family protein [Bryobacteraceae bacterium]